MSCSPLSPLCLVSLSPLSEIPLALPVSVKVNPSGSLRMKIYGIEGMTGADLSTEVAKGGKFVIFQYCFSVIVMSFKRRSPVYFVKADENASLKGLRYTLISALLGWWGIPWGIMFTVQALITNCTGGKDVTQPILSSLNEQPGSAKPS